MNKNGSIDRQEVIRVLRNLRQEWEDATEEPVYEASGNVGLVLMDIVDGLELDPEDVIGSVPADLAK